MYVCLQMTLHLFGQQLLAQRVQADELACQQTGVDEALGDQHDLTDQLEVRDHHGTGPAWSTDQQGIRQAFSVQLPFRHCSSHKCIAFPLDPYTFIPLA